MKNIKVSPPLDGSPDYGSTKYSPVPKGGQSQSLQPVQVQKRTDVSTTRAPNRAFTTQPTLKPACAGCGYVTTSKRPPLSNGQNGIYQSGGISSGQPPKFSADAAGFNTGAPGSSFGAPGSSFGAPGSNFGAPGSSFGAPGSSLGATGFGSSGPGSGSPQSLNNGLIPPAFGSPGQAQNSGINSGSNPQTPQVSNSGYPSSLPGSSSPQLPSSVSSYSDSFSNPQNNQNDVFGAPKGNQHSSQITYRNPDPPVKVTDGVIKVPGNPDIPIKDKYPGMVEGLPAGIMEKDITDILYRFNWTVGFQGHYETGYKNGAKIGGYFVNGSDGISRVVTYVADEFGYRPKVRIINIGLDSPDTPKDDKTFTLKSFEFVWYPVK
ncbi:pro-resilin isoform X2 [Harmonia axyridis]|nr:pro-resilin isoform X2 [Harmonia axyridis]